MASERLRVQKVEVRGGHFLSEGEVRELLGPAVGENILGLDIEALKARLRASPWVADATVSRTLPDTLRVSIHERVPLALAEIDRLYLMDADGGLIDIYGPRTAAFDLPIVRGLLGPPGRGSARPGRTRRAPCSRTSATSGPRSPRSTCSGSGDLKVILRGARRDASPRTASLSSTLPGLPGAAPRARGEGPGDRVLRPPVPRANLRKTGRGPPVAGRSGPPARPSTRRAFPTCLPPPPKPLRPRRSRSPRPRSFPE